MGPLQTTLDKDGSCVLNDRGMLEVFNYILCLARSIGDIEHLHALLPQNCQLLQDDLILMKKHWKQLYANKPPKSGVRLSDEVFLQFVHDRCVKYDLTIYYLLRLDQGREWLKVNPTQVSSRILSSTERSGNGYDHFTASVHGIPMEIGCFVPDNEGSVKVCFTIWQSQLIEPITYALRSVTPFRTSDIGSRAQRFSQDPERKGWHVDFWITLPTKDILKHIEQWEDTSYQPPRYEFIAKDSFTRALEAELNKLGIPVSEILPIPPTKE